jgi:hypothetical protein
MSSATAQIVATSQLADMADILGESSDYIHYTSIHAKLRAAYHEAFFNSTTGSYKGNGTHVWQFANLMPLALNITPSESVPTVLSTLIASIRSGANGVCASAPCIATGFWGTRFMLQTLTRYGQHALAMQLATKTAQPSWGYMVTSNRSVGTLWEAWDGGSLVIGNFCDFNSFWKRARTTLQLPETLTQSLTLVLCRTTLLLVAALVSGSIVRLATIEMHERV